VFKFERRSRYKPTIVSAFSTTLWCCGAEALAEIDCGLAASHCAFLLMIVLIGDSGVGKTNLVAQLTCDQSNPEFRGPDFGRRAAVAV
jgi:ABC-type phosphate/phosphonate transport system ATPase subunit